MCCGQQNTTPSKPQVIVPPNPIQRPMIPILKPFIPAPPTNTPPPNK